MGIAVGSSTREKGHVTRDDDDDNNNNNNNMVIIIIIIIIIIIHKELHSIWFNKFHT